MAKNLYLKKRNFAERYQVEQKVHIVDFVKDKSFMGKITSKTDTLLIVDWMQDIIFPSVLQNLRARDMELTFVYK